MARQLRARFAPTLQPLFDELRALAWLREPLLWLVLLFSIAAWTLAYQWPNAFQLAIGGDRATHRREDDRPFLQAAGQTYHENTSFNASQPTVPAGADTVWWQLPEAPYRWTTADATMAFPGVGGARWLVMVRASGQPTTQPTQSQWSDGAITTTLALAADTRVYHLLANSAASGDLALHFQTTPYSTPNDSRSLGFRMYSIAITPLSGAQRPAWPQLGWLAGSVALCYGIGRRLGARPRWAGWCGVAGALLLAALLVGARLWLTIFTPVLLQLLLGCYVLAVILVQIADCRLQIADRRLQIDRGIVSSIKHQASSIIALIVLAFALRMGGTLHPHTIFSDIGLNANDIIELTIGRVYFTEGLPSEAGGGQAPYPPGQFITLAPGQLLLPASDDARRLLVKIGNALIDGLTIGLLWLVLRRAGASQRAALLGAALYIAPTPLLGSFSVGEFANIFGQGLAMPLLALLAVGGATVRERRGFWIALALLGIALLGHLGVAISLVVMLASLALVWVFSATARRWLVALVLVGALGGGLVALFYYSAFAQLLAARFGGGAAGTPGTLSLLAKLTRQEALLVISPLVLALGATGALLPLRLRGAGMRRVLGAWWLGTALSFGLLLLANQAVRWQHFLYPALCLGGGLLFGALWRRGRAARIAALVTLCFVVEQSAAWWFARLIDYLH